MGDFLKRMDWLGRGRALGYLRLLALLNVAMLVFLVTTSHGGVDRNGFLLGSDFISFWTTGQMLREGGNPYDGAAHIAAQRAFFASDSGYTAFFYPPSFLPFCWPLGAQGYFPALAGWLVATGTLYVVAARRWLADSGLKAPLWLLLLAFPAVPIVVTHGQTSFLVAGLLGLGLLCVPTRKVLAGVLLGLATIKPQFGLLVPIALIVTGEWRVFGTAAVTALALALLSAALFGPQSWLDWLAASERAQAALQNGEVPFAKMMSPFAAAKLLGAGTAAAVAVQGVVTLAVMAAVAWAGWQRKFTFTPALGALVLAGAPLATPFVLDYDMVLLTFPLLWLAGEGLRDGWRNWEKLALTLAFVAPALARPLALNAGLPVMVVVAAGLLWVVLRRSDMHSLSNKGLSNGH